LDLHQTAYHYLYASLLKIKSIANHPDLPMEVRRGLAKPVLEEKEKAALQHVTSCLFNRLEVKQVTERIIGEACETLGLPMPERKRAKKKGDKDKDEEQEGKESIEKADDTDNEEEEVANTRVSEARNRKIEKAEKTGKEEKRPRKEKEQAADDISISGSEDEYSDTDAEERAFAKFDRLVGGSSDSDADSESESDGGVTLKKGRRTTKTIRVRDMSISLSPESSGVSGSEAESEPELESESESESEFEGFSDPEPEDTPAAKPATSTTPSTKQTKTKAAKPAAAPPSRPTDSTFLPSLMGGYISGSESASDVDVAPRKNRLGQKQRQAIWEKKFGAKAKHLQQPQKPQGGKGKNKRDDGWDMRRGAVGEEDERQRKPWKKGIENPLAALRKGGRAGEEEAKRKPTKKDDEGPLHPSWEARKKAKQGQPQKIVIGANSANKIVFD